MRTIYHAESLIDAQLVKDTLEQAGIPAFVLGEYLAGGIGDLPARDFIAVAVPDSCAAAAASVVQTVDARLSEARATFDKSNTRLSGLLPDPP